MSSPRELVIRALIVSDHEAIRAGLRALLSLGTDMRVIGEARGGQHALELLRAEQPDIMLLDLDLPRVGGEELLDLALGSQQAIRILLLTADRNPNYARTLFAKGAAGYLLKEDASRFLLAAARSVYYERDRVWVSPVVLRRANLSGFSSQELAILYHLRAGKSKAEIMLALGVSEQPLEGQLKFLVARLGTGSLEGLREVAGRTLPPEG